MQNVKVGLCGFSMALSTYPKHFRVVEVQQTFYEPPARLRTLEQWRVAMPPPFEFTIKAWQLITHAASSPTYRRLRRLKLSASDRAGAGGFKASRIVQRGWERTVECAQALSASSILFQTPGTFRAVAVSLKAMRAFFTRIERPRGIRLMWEPRGAWPLPVVRSLCEELELVHVVDPFVNSPMTERPTYFRLHGMTGWRHVFSDGELNRLVAMVSREGDTYVMFNNVSCVADAKRFERLLARTQVARAPST